MIRKKLAMHNLILAGQAGTGKTFVLKEVARDLKFLEKRVAILCTTAVITELCKEDVVSTAAWLDFLDKAIQLCQNLPDVAPDKTNCATLLTELENSAVGLWNFSVTLKTKGIITAASNAKIRNIAFLALCFYGEICDEQNDTHWKRQVMLIHEPAHDKKGWVMVLGSFQFRGVLLLLHIVRQGPVVLAAGAGRMGLKTGRAWLDCGQAEMADQVFIKTEKSIKRLQDSVLEKTTSQPGLSSDILEKQKTEVEQDMFTLLCYKAEAGVLQNRAEDSLELVRTAKQLLQKFPKEGSFLSMLCYNLGVELYQRKLFRESTAWLRESYELGKNRQTISPKNQTRTLRLLAKVYLELGGEDDLQNALNAVSLANTEHAHPAGLFLRLKILLMKKEPDSSIKTGAIDMLKVSDLSVDLCLHVLQTVNHYNRIDLMTWLIEEMLKKFEHSPDIGKLLVTNLEVLLQADMRTEAKQFMEYCITAHHTGRPLELTIKKRFHMILWEEAAKAFENDSHKEALDWYNYSLSLYSQTDTGDLNLAKLHRNRANCYLTLGELDKAKEAVSLSEKCDPTNTHTQFILFKLALQENNDAKACESLKKLCEAGRKEDAGDNNSISGLVALAAQQALECDKADTASVALEFLCNTSSDSEQILTALRCLIRLKLVSADKEAENRYAAFSIVNYIRMGYNKLLQIQDTHTDKDVNVHSEASWFMKIAWNLALQCEEQPERMKELYILCSQLLSLGPLDDTTLSRQMMCMLMSAATCLQVAGTTNDDRKLVLEETLEHLTSCRQLCSRLQQMSLGLSDSKAKETEVLLLLYEFEALVKLQDSRVETLLEKALTLPGSDPKTFETMAAIAREPPACNKSVAVRTLKVAIRKHLQSQQPDIVKCSKLFHSLVQMCLNSSSSQDLSGKEEAWKYYMEIFDFIENKAQGQYPEMEIVSLMTKAWNCGINFYSAGNYKEAEKWCGMSMRMLKYLATLKSSFEDLMNNVYSEVLGKVDGKKDDRQSLEF